MKTNFLLIFVLIFCSFFSCIHAQQMTPKMDDFLARMDGATLEELEKELDEALEGIRMFAGFFDGPDEEIRAFTKEEEKYGKPFKIDTSIASLALRQFKNIGFQQTFANNKSFIEFEKIGDDYWSKVWMEEGMTETLIPKAIYYKNGSTLKSEIENNEISFSWEKPWGDVTIIDSVLVEYNLNYAKKYDSVELNAKSKKIKYKDGLIKIEKLEKNHVYFTISDAYSKDVFVRARNADDKIISFSSSSSSPTSDEKSKAGFSEMVAILEDISTKLKAKKFKDTEALKNYLLKKVKKLEVANDNDGVRHKKFYFNGNIESVQLYIGKEANSETITFTAKNNNSFRDILLVQNETETVFLDADSNEIFKTALKRLERVGERLFIEEETYFYLNTDSKNLDRLEAVRVFETKNGLLFKQPTIENGFLAFDINLKQLSNLEFSNVWSVDEEYAHALDVDEKIYTVNAKGKVKNIEGITKVMDLSEGLLLAKLDDKYGFIDASGETIVPCIYNDAELFNEGLAVVKNERGLYGFIDKNGTIALPLIYNRANSFENGIALISNGDAYQLIDKTGKVVVTSNSSGYSTNGSGVKKTYQFGNKKYDAFGKLISEETK